MALAVVALVALFTLQSYYSLPSQSERYNGDYVILGLQIFVVEIVSVATPALAFLAGATGASARSDRRRSQPPPSHYS
jgi:hypothetical protein